MGLSSGINMDLGGGVRNGGGFVSLFCSFTKAYIPVPHHVNAN
jgi:hypothetical protein